MALLKTVRRHGWENGSPRGNPRTDLTVSNFQYNKGTGVITVDIQVAPNAVAGKVPIFIQSGGKTSNPNNNAFFFVQIPTSVAGAPFEGTFDAIPASGAGPQHLPDFGPNDFVFDANGNKVDVNDTQPVCGVYRNYAFQLRDQDQPPQAIKASVPVTENLNHGPSVTVEANNIGLLLDTHAAIKQTSCPQNNEFSDIMQSFVVTAAGQTFNLTTIFHIVVGNVNGSLSEQTEVVHQ